MGAAVAGCTLVAFGVLSDPIITFTHAPPPATAATSVTTDQNRSAHFLSVAMSSLRLGWVGLGCSGNEVAAPIERCGDVA